MVARNTCCYTDNAQSTQSRLRVNTRLCAINLTSANAQIMKEWIGTPTILFLSFFATVYVRIFEQSVR